MEQWSNQIGWFFGGKGGSFGAFPKIHQIWYIHPMLINPTIDQAMKFHIIFLFLPVCFGLAPQITRISANQSVLENSDVTFSCSVGNLSGYRVSIQGFEYTILHWHWWILKFKMAWVHSQRRSILAIGKHIITRNPRWNVLNKLTKFR